MVAIARGCRDPAGRGPTGIRAVSGGCAHDTCPTRTGVSAHRRTEQAPGGDLAAARCWTQRCGAVRRLVELHPIWRPLVKPLEDAVKHAKALPTLIRPMDRAVVWILLRQMVPAAAGLRAVDDSVERTSLIDPLSAKAARWVVLLENRLYRFPGLVRDVDDRSVGVYAVRGDGHNVPPFLAPRRARSVPYSRRHLNALLAALSTARVVRRDADRRRSRRPDWRFVTNL